MIMSYRSVMISNPAFLQVQDAQLTLTINNEKHFVPLQDIACMILNNYQINLTGALLSACAEYNIVIISCDKKHVPNGIFHSFLPHSRQSLVLDRQINLTVPFKKRLWRIIIQRKIMNQAQVLENLNFGNVDKLQNIINKVLSGDSTNQEAYASKIYFPSIFGDDFVRITKNKNITHNNISINYVNAMLNYAYTIVRSLICRSLVGYGFMPSLGLFHDNQLNAFNLADDFIEPIRPYVDFYIYYLMMLDLELMTNVDLTVAVKAKLVDILNYMIIIDEKKTTLLTAIDIMIKSFATVMQTNNYNCIKLPYIPKKIEKSNID
jgi:CRISPR-associated protein Cas1